MTTSSPTKKALEAIAKIHGLTFGYIGTAGHFHDDRSWRVFAPHPGRIGTRADCFGDHATDELDALLLAVASERFLHWVNKTPQQRFEDSLPRSVLQG